MIHSDYFLYWVGGVKRFTMEQINYMSAAESLISIQVSIFMFSQGGFPVMDGNGDGTPQDGYMAGDLPSSVSCTTTGSAAWLSKRWVAWNVATGGRGAAPASHNKDEQDERNQGQRNRGQWRLMHCNRLRRKLVNGLRRNVWFRRLKDLLSVMAMFLHIIYICDWIIFR
eukprot:scpid24787/ scgid16791/ 